MSDFDCNIVNLIRSIMYGSSEEGNENLLQEVEFLGETLAKRDGVPYNRDCNRMTKAFLLVQSKDWNGLEHLNDPKV